MSDFVTIHRLITVEMDQAFPWREAWFDRMGDVVRFSEVVREPIAGGGTLKLVYARSLSADGTRKLNDGVQVGNGALVDLKYGVRLEPGEQGSVVLRASNPCLEWFEWGLQLAFLAAGATLVHAAAVESDGDAILFPSWGGIGKTALVAGMVSEGGCNLLGDDFVVLDSDGVCYAFPTPMVLYAYHRSIFPQAFPLGRRLVAPLPLDRLLTKLGAQLKPRLRRFPKALQFARKHNPQSVRVNPSQVFGPEKLAARGKAKVVVWLDRVKGLDRPQLAREQGSLASRIMGATISQYDPWCVSLTHVAMGSGIIDAERFYSAWLGALRQGLGNCAQYTLLLPADLPVSEVSPVVRDLLARNGIWGR